MNSQETKRPEAFSVAQVNEYIKMLLEGNPVLHDLWVVGEVSGAKVYASGHLYFSLKDQNSVLSAVMFRGALSQMKFQPENGMRMLVHGRLSSYVPRGEYQLIADHMVPEGAGALAAAFEQLKAKLGAEGLFDPARKKPLPPHPRRIGVVTSASGAAVHDIIRVARKRCPSTEILLFPTPVQGAEAVRFLPSGIEYFNKMRGDPEQGVDLIIIGRGGGSTEDLWAFNDERLARTIAASVLPVVSAVGHEVDFTISDFVADLRAATPSAAAELALPDNADWKHRVDALRGRMEQAEAARISRCRALTDQLARARVLVSPEGVYKPRREALSTLEHRLSLAADRRVTEKKQSFGRLAGQLGALNPLGVLSRGYALVQKEDGYVVPAASELRTGDTVTLRFAHDRAVARVVAIQNEEYTSDTEQEERHE